MLTFSESHFHSHSVIPMTVHFLSLSGVDDVGTPLHIVRLLTFQPGILLCEIPYTADVLYEVGKYVGAIDRALKVGQWFPTS